MNHQPGEIITLTSQASHYVYGLLDDDGNIFYVGRTGTPSRRLREHLNCPRSVELRDKLASVSTPRMQILGGPMSEEVARRVEWICIQVGIQCLDLVNGETRMRSPRSACNNAEEYLALFPKN